MLVDFERIKMIFNVFKKSEKDRKNGDFSQVWATKTAKIVA